MRLFRSHTSIFSRALRGTLGIVVISLVFTGCKSPEFISSRYDNFTAYYNKFYNARQAFDKGYKALTQAQTPVDRVRYLPIYQRTTGSGSRDFDSAVLKSADLLRNHPDSKWVDDALLLIGKSYFYQENFVGATQKFREVIDLNTALSDEAVFWLARSLITSGALDEAEKEIVFALAKEDVDSKWASQYGLLMAELKIKLSAWEDASNYLSLSIGEVKDKMTAGRAQFLLGQVLERQGRYVEAVEAFERVNKYTPSYELLYAASFSAVRVEGKHVDPSKALVKLRKMERDDKHFSNLAELQLLRARIWQDIGRDSESFDIYNTLLYDQNPTRQASAVTLKGRIHYALGELYRDVDRDFVMAAAHFDTASASLETSTGARSRIRSSSYSATQVQYAPEAITDAIELKTSFLKFSKVFKEIAHFDSLLWLGLMPAEEYEAKLLEIRKQRAAEQAAQQKLLDERLRAQAFESGPVALDTGNNFGLPPGKIVPGINDAEGIYDGFLFHKNIVRVQEGRTKFDNTWGRRALAPNWRRSSVLVATTAPEKAEEEAEEEAVEGVTDEGLLPTIDTTEVPRDSTKQAATYTLRANARYELGNTLFLSMARPDSAAVWYRTVIEEDSAQVVAQRAYYALAEVQRALGDTDSADRLYRDILENYPDSDFSDDVRSRLGLDPIDRAESDSTILARIAYEAAYAFGEEAPLEESINRYLEVAADWLKYEQSGQALLAAARVYMLGAGADSLKIFSPIPVTVSYEKMQKLWPIKFGWVEPDSVLIVDDVLVADTPSTPEAAPPVVSDEPVHNVDLASTVDSLSTGTDSLAVSEVVPPVDPVSADSVSVDPVSVDPVVSAPVIADQGLAANPTYRIVEAHERRNPLYVEDIFTKVASNYSGKALGIVADRTRKAIIERRTPPPDTTKTQVLTESGIPTDSLRLADGLEVQSDSSLTPTDLENDQILSAEQDSTGALIVPMAGSPGIVGAPVTVAPETEDVFNTEDDDVAGARTSSNLKPLLPTGRPNLDAVGWTVMLGYHITLEGAKADLQVQNAKLGGARIPIFLITNAEGERFEFIVGWGLFESKELADEAIVKYVAFLPPSRNYLHLIAPAPRKP